MEWLTVNAMFGKNNHIKYNTGTPEMPFPPDMQMQGTKMGQSGMILPNGTDIRDVTILSKSEWNRIQQELHKRQIEEERMRRLREEKENRKQMSKEMVQHWGNTIAVSLAYLHRKCLKM